MAESKGEEHDEPQGYAAGAAGNIRDGLLAETTLELLKEYAHGSGLESLGKIAEFKFTPPIVDALVSTGLPKQDESITEYAERLTAAVAQNALVDHVGNRYLSLDRRTTALQRTADRQLERLDRKRRTVVEDASTKQGRARLARKVRSYGGGSKADDTFIKDEFQALARFVKQDGARYLGRSLRRGVARVPGIGTGARVVIDGGIAVAFGDPDGMFKDPWRYGVDLASEPVETINSTVTSIASAPEPVRRGAAVGLQPGLSTIVEHPEPVIWATEKLLDLRDWLGKPATPRRPLGRPIGSLPVTYAQNYRGAVDAQRRAEAAQRAAAAAAADRRAARIAAQMTAARARADAAARGNLTLPPSPFRPIGVLAPPSGTIGAASATTTVGAQRKTVRSKRTTGARKTRPGRNTFDVQMKAARAASLAANA
jgi:hypothetical protein